jgi:hypothetical protein
LVATVLELGYGRGDVTAPQPDGQAQLPTYLHHVEIYMVSRCAGFDGTLLLRHSFRFFFTIQDRSFLMFVPSEADVTNVPVN